MFRRAPARESLAARPSAGTAAHATRRSAGRRTVGVRYNLSIQRRGPSWAVATPPRTPRRATREREPAATHPAVRRRRANVGLAPAGSPEPYAPPRVNPRATRGGWSLLRTFLGGPESEACLVGSLLRAARERDNLRRGATLGARRGSPRARGAAGAPCCTATTLRFYCGYYSTHFRPG